MRFPIPHFVLHHTPTRFLVLAGLGAATLGGYYVCRYNAVTADDCCRKEIQISQPAAVGIVETNLTALILGVPLPNGPVVKGQAKPPCHSDPEVEVSAKGACWLIIGKRPKPKIGCGPSAYEYQHPTLGGVRLLPSQRPDAPNTAIQE